jgi:hypothetical protein
MSYGNFRVFTGTIASGASTSAGIQIGAGGYKSVNVQVATMSTAAAISVQLSSDGGTTYYNYFHPTLASSTVGTPQVFLASGLGTNGGVQEFQPIFMVTCAFLRLM